MTREISFNTPIDASDEHLPVIRKGLMNFVIRQDRNCPIELCQVDIRGERDVENGQLSTSMLCESEEVDCWFKDETEVSLQGMMKSCMELAELQNDLPA